MASTTPIEITPAVRIAAWLSDGIRLCVTQGPASGTMMRYACRDQAGGRGPVGRWVDRRFLNYAGWEGVRRRRLTLRQLIVAAIEQVRADGKKPVRLLDLAGGTSDYVVDALAGFPADAVTAMCVDSDPLAVELGARRAVDEGSANVRFEVGDVTDGAAVARLAPDPDVVVCSGFYELLTDDAAVLASIQSIARMLHPGGRFVVSHQAARPSATGLGRIIWKSAAGAVTMKMRSADRVAEMMTAAGFVVERTASAAGLYTLFLTRRS